MIDRRSFLQLALAAQAFAALPARASTPGLRRGEPQPFSYDWLKTHAQELAGAAYSPPPRPDPKIVSSIDYDAHGQIHYKTDLALFGDGEAGAYPVTFMHVGGYFPKSVRMYAVEQSGGQDVAREILYDPSYFAISSGNVAAQLPGSPSPMAGCSGCGSQRPGPRTGAKPSPGSRSGASYFRGKGELGQVGMSARGIALSPGGSSPEEFPDFTGFWFLPAPPESKTITVCALLDGPSVACAYRFVMERTKGVVMEIETALYFRQAVERLGLAPLTTMFWYSETVKRAGIDWRPLNHLS